MPTDLQPISRYVDVNDVTLYCEVFGNGDPLVLLHGGLGSGRDWEHIIPAMVEQYRVITIDVRGHGRSTNPTGALSYPQIADDLAKAIGALGLERPFIAGWSDGGQHVLQLGYRYPGLARALLVGAADFRSSDESRIWVREFFGIGADGEVALEVLDEMLGDSASRYHAKHAGGATQWELLARGTARLWLEYDGLSDEDYRLIEAPTLVMLGDRDDDVPVEDAVRMYRAIRNAELAICPCADHFIPWRRAKWLVATMDAFLQRQHSSD